MALINIVDYPHDGCQRQVEESRLVKTTGADETEDTRIEWVEYRWPGSDVIVHRSAHVTVKRFPPELGGLLMEG
jgi:hypothetical protein